MARQAPIFVGMGELLWDCFDDSRQPGGAPANTAFHAHQLGCESYIFSRVGSDSLGDELVRYIESKHLATEFIGCDAVHPTGTVTVDSSRPDAPSYVIHEPVAWDFLELTDAGKDLLHRADAFCFGTLAQRNPIAREAIHAALASLRPSALVIYDVNLRQAYYDRASVERSLAASRLVKLNVQEVGVLAELLAIGSSDPLVFAKAIQKKYGVDTVCVTRAENGCLLVTSDEVVDAPGVAVEVVDAVGAGDAFNAAMAVARLRGLSPRDTAELSNAMGALVASRQGAMPELGDALDDLTASYAGSEG